jgi:hypothetical protein
VAAGLSLAGWLLAAGPAVGLLPVGHPALLPVWSMPRERFVATVGAHRIAWAWLNAGFTLATIASAAGLVVLALALPGSPATGVMAAAVCYAVGGGLWCAVLAMRTRTTPLLADMDITVLDSLGVALFDAASGALFQAFVLITGLALAGLGIALLAAAVVPLALGLVLVVSGIGTTAWMLRTGDVIPALLYLPTLILGVALLAGWAA